MGKRWEKLTSISPSDPGMDLLTPIPSVGLARVPAWLSLPWASAILRSAARSCGLLLETLFARDLMLSELLLFVGRILLENVGR